MYSKVNQLDMYTHPSLFRLFSHIIYYRILSWFPYAMQQVLVDDVFYIQKCICVNPKLLIYPSRPHLSPQVTISLISESMSLFVFVNKLLCIIFIELYTELISYDSCPCMTYITQDDGTCNGIFISHKKNEFMPFAAMWMVLAFYFFN